LKTLKKNYYGAYGENFKKFKTVITPVVHKIESLFLVLGYGFGDGQFNGVI